MEKINTSILISASKEKVWNVMLSPDTYRIWTAAFHEGSYYKGTLAEGEKILFIGPGEEGEMGMVSRVAEMQPYDFISFEHLGIYKNGVEDTESVEAKKWSPAFENYSFEEVDGKTKISVDQDIQSEYKEMFEGMWEKALNLLKELAEK
jgi:uncharacterized protein YndB with AHSA1/START domain